MLSSLRKNGQEESRLPKFKEFTVFKVFGMVGPLHLGKQGNPNLPCCGSRKDRPLLIQSKNQQGPGGGVTRGHLYVLSATLILSKNPLVLGAKSRLKSANLN